ncbi:MAG: hypothetical protein J0M15_14115 [Deltaproteobacteria bacterium]|nr:hypothetical protein [Deltaproteobacteria bacterium]
METTSHEMANVVAKTEKHSESLLDQAKHLQEITNTLSFVVVHSKN